MTEKDYWVKLMFRVSGELAGMEDNALRFLWCDGFLAEQYLLDDPTPRITGRTWIGSAPRQAEWGFTLFLPGTARTVDDIAWSALFPPNEATGWLGIDQEQKQISIRFGAPAWSFTFEEDGTAHGDLVVSIGKTDWRCDSYYLALDQSMLPEQEDGPKVRVVLRALLEKWRTAIVSLADGAIAYLPYDFSDQYTAWLTCERAGGELLVRRGSAHVAGWSISPSNPPSPATKPAGFQPDGGPWRFSLEGFLGGIDRSIAAVGGGEADRAH